MKRRAFIQLTGGAATILQACSPAAPSTPAIGLLDQHCPHRARAGGVFLPRDADWLTETEDLRRGFVLHPELDLSVTGPLV
jgi:hypothetical protein